MKFSVVMVTLAAVGAVKITDEYDGPKDPARPAVAKKKLEKYAPGVEPRKPAPFRFPAPKPKTIVKQVLKPNYTVVPHYDVPAP